jgi:hypothetical protein
VVAVEPVGQIIPQMEDQVEDQQVLVILDLVDTINLLQHNLINPVIVELMEKVIREEI